MSKLTVIARFYTIILTGYHQTKGQRSEICQNKKDPRRVVLRES